MFSTPRLTLVVLLLLTLAASAYAQQDILPRVTENRISFHSLDVFILPDGSATVEERFFFTFFADEDRQFVKDFEENTPSLAEWKKDYPFVNPHIGAESQVENIQFLLNRTPDEKPTLTMSYAYPQGLVQQIKVGNQGRSTHWKISDIALLDFIEGGNIRIPANTQVRIHLPAGAVLDTSLLPQGVTYANSVISLSNFQSNALEIEYILLTPIADPIDAGQIIENVLNSPLFLVLVAIVAMVGAYVALHREKILDEAENYIIAHSEFRPSPKQDIDGDLETPNTSNDTPGA